MRNLTVSSAMLLLFDGYNLLYAVGYGTPGMSRTEWNTARRKLLDWLATGQACRPEHKFRVILDAQNQTNKQYANTVYQGLEVVQAIGQTADDYIEQLLQQNHSQEVVVISNDQRLIDAAKRAGATSWTRDRYLDWLLDEPEGLPAPVPTSAEKPVVSETDAEKEALLAVFTQPKKRK